MMIGIGLLKLLIAKAEINIQKATKKKGKTHCAAATMSHLHVKPPGGHNGETFCEYSR